MADIRKEVLCASSCKYAVPISGDQSASCAAQRFKRSCSSVETRQATSIRKSDLENLDDCTYELYPRRRSSARVPNLAMCVRMQLTRDRKYVKSRPLAAARARVAWAG